MHELLYKFLLPQGMKNRDRKLKKKVAKTNQEEQIRFNLKKSIRRARNVEKKRKPFPT